MAGYIVRRGIYIPHELYKRHLTNYNTVAFPHLKVWNVVAPCKTGFFL